MRWLSSSLTLFLVHSFIYSFILCEETTLDLRDSERKCTHLMFTFKQRKQMHKVEIVTSCGSTVMEVGRGRWEPGGLTTSGREAETLLQKGYKMTAGPWSTSRNLPFERKEFGVPVRVHRIRKVPVRLKSTWGRRELRDCRLGQEDGSEPGGEGLYLLQ